MPKSRVRYQIFVSSTYTDLLEARQAAVEAILRAGHIPAGMELFAAQNRPQMEVIQEWIEESDVFCLILGARYGSIEPASGNSYVECEYEHAIQLGKPVFCLVLDDKWIDKNLAELGRKAVLEHQNEARLKLFRERITSTLVRMVANPDSIKVAIFESLGTLERGYDIEGWVRSKEVLVPPQVGEELARLSAENARLTSDLAAATTAGERLIEGKSMRDWVAVLSQYSFEDWDASADRINTGIKVSLHKAFTLHGHHLGAGVANGFGASGFQSWLFGFATVLASLGLVETKKVPASVHWQRLGLSASGKRLYAALIAEQAQGGGFIANTDLMTELTAVFGSGSSTPASSQSASDSKLNDAPRTPPIKSPPSPPHVLPETTKRRQAPRSRKP